MHNEYLKNKKLDEIEFNFLNTKAFLPDAEKKPMGNSSHPALAHTYFFTRQFRFRFMPQSDIDLHLWVRKVKWDRVNQHLTLSLYDNEKTRNWIPNIGKTDDIFIFETYDGCGKVVWRARFYGQLSLLEHSLTCDYDSSETINQDIKIGYECCSENTITKQIGGTSE